MGVATHLNTMDFDGDELNCTLYLDNMLAEIMKKFKSHYSVPDLSKPFNISGNLNIMSTATSILSNYLHSPNDAEKDTVSSKLKYVDVEI